MDGAAIEHIHPLRLRWGDLGNLSEQQRAVFTMLSFAVSEVNALRRICLFALNTLYLQPKIEPAAEIQRNVLLRILTAKFFEFIKFYNSINKNGIFDPKIKEIFSRYEVDFGKIQIGKGYDVAKIIRNKLSNHYDLDFVIDAAKGVQDSTDCTLFFTEAAGNQYFPIGETVAFGHAFAGQNGHKAHGIKDEEDLDAWVNWTIQVSGFMNIIHRDVFVEIVQPNIDGRKVKKELAWLDRDLVGVVDKFRLPIFIRELS